MKVSNLLVKLQYGNKTYNYKNLILNTYFKALINMHKSTSVKDYHSPVMKCYFKFEDNIEFNEESILSKDDFDMNFECTYYNEVTSDKSLQIERNYNIYFNSGYSGKQLKTIGFGIDDCIYACLDVSDEGIVFQQDEIISVERIDLFSLSDNLNVNYNNSLYKYPLHLSEGVKKTNVIGTRLIGYTYIYAHLEEIGYGYNKNKANRYTKIKEIIADFKDFSLEIDNSLSNINNLYPSEFLYPSEMLFPKHSKYTYIFLKFKLYKYEINEIEGTTSITELPQYYTYSILVNDKDKFKFILKYERGD